MRTHMVIGMRAFAQSVLSLPGMTTSQLRMSCVPSASVFGLATKPCGQRHRAGNALDGTTGLVCSSWACEGAGRASARGDDPCASSSSPPAIDRAQCPYFQRLPSGCSRFAVLPPAGCRRLFLWARVLSFYMKWSSAVSSSLRA